MTKEEWIRYRKEPVIPLGVWFSFFKERGGKEDDPIVFEEAFDYAIKHEITVVYQPSGRHRKVTKDSALYQLHSYYDNIFQLC